jgi:deoxyribonuclease-4
MAAREHVRIGAHLNGGVNKATAHADRIGLSAGPIQLFARSPSGWRTPNHKDTAVGKFRAACAERELGPAFIHGIYLMNFASLDERIYQNSLNALTDEFRIAARLGVSGIVIHPGAAKGQSVPEALDRAAGALRHCLDATADDAGEVELLLETCAGQGTTLGRTLEELAGLLERLDNDPRVAICLDTCHMHAAGYSLTPRAHQSAAAPEAADAAPSGKSRHSVVQQTGSLEETVAVCDRTVGLSRLRLVHANDSKVPFGTNRDRHENIGCGTIGEADFAAVLAHPALRSLPFVLEVPGFDKKGPDAPNLEALRRLAG